MKRKSSFFLFFLLITLTLFACSKGETPGSQNGGGAETPETDERDQEGDPTKPPPDETPTPGTVTANLSLSGLFDGDEPGETSDAGIEVLEGATVHLKWNLSEADNLQPQNVAKSSLVTSSTQISLFKNEILIANNLPLTNSYEIHADEEATYTLHVKNASGEETTKSITIKPVDTVCLGKKNCSSHPGMEQGFKQIFYQPFSFKKEDETVCILVADAWNNRVVQSCGSEIEEKKFGRVLGQPDLISDMVNQGGKPSLATLSDPRGVWSNGKATLIADTGNHRILIWRNPPERNGAPADLVLGQPNGESNAKNILFSPSAVWVDEAADKIFVADTNNNRILIKNGFQNLLAHSSDVDAGAFDVVVGEAGNPTATSLNAPRGVSTFEGKLLISDSQNNRILIFNSIPEENGASADAVIGQPDFNSKNPNQGPIDYAPWAVEKIEPRPGAATLVYPVGIYGEKVNGKTKYWISDQYNFRILRWDPELGKADLVIGFDGFDKQAWDLLPENGKPRDMISEKFLYLAAAGPPVGCRLFVNSASTRILEFDICDLSQNNPAAIRVIGQPGFTTISRNRTANSNQIINDPVSVWAGDDDFWIASPQDGRLVGFQGIPSFSGAKAKLLVGKSGLGAAAKEIQVALIAYGEKSLYPESVFADAKRFLVSDGNNYRLLLWNRNAEKNVDGIPILIGQSALSDSQKPPSKNPGCNHFVPKSATMDAKNLYVADGPNHRVLVFNPIPPGNGASANFVIGQSDCNANSRNQGDTQPSDNTLSAPSHVFSDSQHLLITDYANNRVLYYDTLPTESNAKATFVIGQTDFKSKSPNGGANQPNNRGLFLPMSAILYNNLIFVADYGNNRVMVFPIPTANFPEALHQWGQTDFTKGNPNGGAQRSKEGFYFLQSLWVYKDKYLITAEGERGNQRVMVKNIEKFLKQQELEHMSIW